MYICASSGFSLFPVCNDISKSCCLSTWPLSCSDLHNAETVDCWKRQICHLQLKNFICTTADHHIITLWLDNTDIWKLSKGLGKRLQIKHNPVNSGIFSVFSLSKEEERWQCHLWYSLPQPSTQAVRPGPGGLQQQQVWDERKKGHGLTVLYLFLLWGWVQWAHLL